MQVRIANRQDEKQIRELAEAFSLKREDASFDLKGADSDLVNVEANYFGKEGLFLVVDDDGAIAGFAGANSKADDVLRVKRFAVKECPEKPEIEKELMRVIVEFAPRLLYGGIEFDVDLDIEESVLRQYNFSKSVSGQDPYLEVEPDF